MEKRKKLNSDSIPNFKIFLEQEFRSKDQIIKNDAV